MDSVNNQNGQLLFAYGVGDTRKTFLYKTIIAKLRSVGKPVIPIASVGIITLLLPERRTTHSRFNLPLNLSEESVCDITPKFYVSKSDWENKLDHMGRSSYGSPPGF